MSSGWVRRPLGEVLQLQNGFAFDSKKFGAKGLPLIRIRDLKSGTDTETMFEGDFDDRYLVNAGDLLIGMDGEFRCHEWSGPQSLLNQRVCRLYGFSEELAPRFVLYGINKYLKDIEDVTAFATVKHLSSKQILGINFPTPSIEEQNRIVAILDEAFAGIAIAKANAEKNLQSAREVFQEVLAVKLGLGDWPERRLGGLCEIARGGSPRPIKAFFTDAADGVNWIKISDASASSKYIYRTKEKIKPSGVSRSRLVHSGDFLLSNSMSFGRPYIMRTSGCIHDGWLVLSGYEGNFDQNFLFLLLGSQFMYQQFDRLAAGSTVRNLNIELASRVSVPVPPLATQKEIAKELEALDGEVSNLQSLYTRKLAALDELKQSLLHQAFSGQL